LLAFLGEGSAKIADTDKGDEKAHKEIGLTTSA
jgi:hypothetical protein